MKRPAAFAIPGDIATVTGGYIYERRLLGALSELGHPMQHLRLGAGFPDPDAAETDDAVAQMSALSPDIPVIVDGLVFGALETAGFAQVRAPVVAMIHHPLALESGLAPARAEQLFRTERDNLRLASHVVVPSPHTKRILVERYGAPPEAITIAPPGTDRPPSARRSPAAPPLILSVGILHPRKGHDILLRALADLTGLDWQAVIVGKEHAPGEMQRLERLRDDLNLGGRVRLAGKIGDTELDRLFREATLFALATRYEGYGMVFDEALSYGLPIVSCRVGAVPDTVPANAGLLVQGEDAKAFAAALDRLLTDNTLRQTCAANATRAGRSLPGWPETGRIVSAVLDRL
ncbi:glycosyltransferase family 4 protein [Sulfitobacter sp. D35]|uniref:glycosyltransferase family 4 protein n=1 Tax=Sulfitobacter sp. D35 TaxID=3083252 RepID=UPI00296F19D3|nr:glycosyltransferase family 4 protein [Sulfitobacter sp. D35]MDW4497931.1 glycosyltransferase family 4 protein [Sulfitobacter sp. D35]